MSTTLTVTATASASDPNAFSLLHRLGDRRIANASPNLLVTRRSDGSLALAVAVTISVLDNDHGSTLASYRALGSPQYPTPEQVRKINAATALSEPDRIRLDGSHLELRLQVNALALIEKASTRRHGKMERRTDVLPDE